ncbi:tripartite tricarboxylate transporter substrate-binding protein [Achromobacter xylosoxidans]
MKALRTVIAALLLSASLPLAQAANAYPAKPITIVYPYAPGSASDTMTRLLAEAMSKRLGQPVIVESKPGAGGSIATEHVVRAAPDGYTLLLSASGTIAVNPHLYKLRYNRCRTWRRSPSRWKCRSSSWWARVSRRRTTRRSRR